MGLPRYPHHLCDVPCPLPRRTGWRLSTPSAIRTAFPDPGGSASATALSRPAQASLALWPTASLDRPRRSLSRGFDTTSFPATPLVSFRSYRLLSGWNPPPQVIRALVAHQDARGPMSQTVFHCTSVNGGLASSCGSNTACTSAPIFTSCCGSPSRLPSMRTLPASGSSTSTTT